MRGTRRHALGTAAATTLFSLVGLTVGVQPASADIGAELSYSCITPAGTKEIGVRVAGTVPAHGSVGSLLEFGQVTLTTRIDSADLSAFVASDSTGGSEEPEATQPLGVGGTAEFSVKAAQGNTSTDVQWPTFPIKADDSQQARTVELAGTQSVPPLIPGVPGRVKLLSGALELKLSTGIAQSSADPITCTPREAIEIADIEIGGREPGGQTSPGEQKTAPSQPSATFAGEETNCKELVRPSGYFNDDPGLNQDVIQGVKTPAEYNPNNLRPNVGTPFCVDLTGFANSSKLAGAIPVAAESIVRRGTRSLQIGLPAIFTHQRGVALAIPRDSRATLLGFGFMPTTVSVQAQQVAGANGDQLANFRNDLYSNSTVVIPGLTMDDRVDRVWIRANVSVLAKEALVNGVPLNLGPGCRSARNPVQVESFLGSDIFGGKTALSDGSSYTGRLTVLPFENCGVGEDLSPLLTATSSGGNNFTGLEASPWCNVADVAGQGCEGTPRRPGPVKTISLVHGEELAAKLPSFTITVGDGAAAKQIRCDSAQVRFKLRNGHWLPRQRVGQVTAFNTSGCIVNPDGIPVEVTRNSALPGSVDIPGSRSPEVWDFVVHGFQFRVTDRERGCEMLLGKRAFGASFPPTSMDFRLQYNNPKVSDPQKPKELTGAQDASNIFPGGVLSNNCGAPLNFPPNIRVTAIWPTSTLESSPPLSITSP